ncbi:MAG: Abi family protein [Candidatus Tokpelaia sp.]|nr:MAG: Abi family protein [Candidatus Tokpelaia sp.]KAA6206865.1 MAG: Abi family protein [Candidatus Tokpelaia sp.]
MTRRPPRKAKIISDTNRELQKPNNLFTRHYKQVYDRPLLPPLWITAELLTFGTLSKLLADLRQPADRNAIARPYSLDETIFLPVLQHLSYIRNICAHHGRLWNRDLIIKQPIAKKPEFLAQSLNSSANNKIYNALVYIAHLLKIIKPEAVWKTKIKHCVTTRPPSADLRSMGFSPDWQLKPLWH